MATKIIPFIMSAFFRSRPDSLQKAMMEYKNKRSPRVSKASERIVKEFYDEYHVPFIDRLEITKELNEKYGG